MSTITRTLQCMFLAAFVAVIYLGSAPLGWSNPATDAEMMQIRPTAEGSPAALLADNDCWTGEAPANMQGVIPGHVVVTVDGVARVGGERMVGMALGQLFDGADHGLLVHGFCA